MEIVVQVGICKETSMEKAKLLPGMPGCWWHLCCWRAICVREFIPQACLVLDLYLPGFKLTLLSHRFGCVFLIQVFLSPFLPSIAAPALEGTSHPLFPCLLMCMLAQDGNCCCNYCYSRFQQHLNPSKWGNQYLAGLAMAVADCATL